MKIIWDRSDEGFVEDKTKTFCILPNFWGRTTPQSFSLSFHGKTVCTYPTQSGCKRRAEKIVDDALVYYAQEIYRTKNG
jgi:hypothetical protein